MNLDDRARSATQELVGTQPPDVDTMLEELYRRRQRGSVVRIAATASVLAAVVLGWAVVQGREPNPPPVGPTEVTNGALVAHGIGTGFSMRMGTVAHLPRDAEPTTDLQFTADGAALVYLDRFGRFVAQSVTDGHERVLGECPASDGDCSFALSPDGRRLVVARYDHGAQGLRVVDVGTSSNARVVSREQAMFPTWSPDGARLAFIDIHGLHVMAADGSSDRVVVQLGYPDRGVNGRPSWSPDGDRISFVEATDIDVPDAPPERTGLRVYRYTLSVVDVGSGEVTDLGDLGYCVCLGTPAPTQTWSPDGRRIAATSVVEGEDEPLNARVGPMYLVRPDGSGSDQLPPLDATSLAWQPVTANGSD